MSDLSRRKFLGAAAAAATLAGCKTKAKEDAFALERPAVPGAPLHARGEESFVKTICGQCAAGCGLSVRVVDGRAVKVEGNADFPLNGGGVGPKAQSSLELLYHPDRLRGPLKREGERGSGKWRSVSWGEAIAEIGGRLAQLRARSPQALVIVDGEPRGIVHELWSRFAATFGTPNHVTHREAVDGGKVLASRLMSGAGELPAYDWERTHYVLGMGPQLLQSWCQTIHMARASSTLRRGVPGRRVKFVHVSPRFSTTAGKADEWIPLEVGTYGAFALGLAHVLVREGLYDQAFVKAHTFGFEEWKDAKGTHRGFRQVLLEDYPVESAAKITGVPIETFERIARELVEFKPAIVLADQSASASTNGLPTEMAINALNALLGNLERPGGVLIQERPPLAEWPALAADPVARAGLAAPRIDGACGTACAVAESRLQALPTALLEGKPYAAEALFLYKSNPVFSKPDGARWQQALAQVPLLVSFSPFADESTLLADYVLPDHTFLERWEVVEPAPANGRPVLGLRQPVVQPLYDTRPTGEVLLALAKAVGGEVEAAFPWESYREATEARLEGLVGKGKDPAEDVEGLLEAMAEKGGWWAEERKYEDFGSAFATPSKKFEFYSQTLATRLKEVYPAEGQLDRHLLEGQITARGDSLFMPRWEPAVFAGAAAEYPLLLLPYRSINYAEGGVRHLRRLVELPIRRRPTRQRAELNPKDAQALGLSDGERVQVETPAGIRELWVRVDPGVRPGTMAVALGYGVWPPKPNQAPTGLYGLLANVSDPLGGLLALHGTRARIRRA